MLKLADLKGKAQPWREMEAKIAELAALVDLGIEEGDRSLEEEARCEIDGLVSRLDELEFQLAFQGEYDARDAILALHAGAGGTESQDWAEMLLRMYLRWAERRGYRAEVLEVTAGEEAGIKTAVVEVAGGYAYGWLKSEHGVHRLVRLSPFDADHARHTSFALVEVLPQAEEEVDIKIAPEDLRIDVFRASGPGGQHMQKTSTAVRVTHLPTKLVVSYQSERSQLQNKEIALKILHARLLELELEKKAEERNRLKGEHVAAGWGNQIRSYVLHPYKMAKDHRTGYETSDAAAVLDGDLDELLKAYQRSQMGRES
jgi:peptide chain release factor 2